MPLPSLEEIMERWLLAVEGAATAISNDHVPWYEVLTMKYDPATLAPLLEVTKDLIETARTAANLSQDVLEMIGFCAGIARCVVEAGMQGNLQAPISDALQELRDDMGEIWNIAQTISSGKPGDGQGATRTSPVQGVPEELKQRLKDKMNLILRSLVVHQATPGATTATSTRVALAEREVRVYGGMPKLPSSYVRRAAEDSVIVDLVDPKRQASSCHCVWGMGGIGKSLLAASVVSDERILSSFKGGVFWITVGRVQERDHRVFLLEELSTLFAETSKGSSYSWPQDYIDTTDAIYHLKEARGDARCLVVLDDVLHDEVIDVFAEAGFHLLLTSHQRSVVSRRWSGASTEVLKMTDEEALTLLREASQAVRPLPEHEAILVAEMCERLPLALSMAGRLGRRDPLQPMSWSGVLKTLEDKKRSKGAIGPLLTVIDATIDMLPPKQKEQFESMSVLAAGVPISVKMMANLWEEVKEDAEKDAKVLVDFGLVHEIAGAYMLHSIMQEIMQLRVGKAHHALFLALSRHAKFLVAPETLKSYTTRKYDCYGGLHSLVIMWATIKILDPSRRIWDDVEGLEEASTDKGYMEKVGILMEWVGEVSDAEMMFKRILAEEGAGDSSLDIHAILGDIRSLDGEGESKATEPPSHIPEPSPGPENPNYSTKLLNLARVLGKQQRDEEAEPLYRHALTVTERSLGVDHPAYLLALDGLANLLEKQAKDGEAETLYDSALTIMESSFEPGNPFFLKTLNSFTRALTKQKKFEQAEPFFIRASTVAEASIGTEHPLYSVILKNFAHSLMCQGRFEEAESQYRRGLTVVENILGTDFPMYSKLLSTLGMLLSYQEKYVEAESVYRRAITITEASQDVCDPSYLNDLDSFAKVLAAQGKYQEAESRYECAIDIAENTLGAEHPEYTAKLRNYESLLERQGKEEEVEALYRRVMDFTESTLGANHPEYAKKVKNLAELFVKRGKYDEAEDMYRRAVSIMETSLGADHPEYATNLRILGGLLAKRGKDDKAKELYLRAKAIAEASVGKDHPQYAMVLKALADLFEKQGNDEEAEKLYRRAVTIIKDSLGTEHATYSSMIQGLAAVLHKKGKHQEAEELYNTTSTVTWTTANPDQVQTAIEQMNMAATLKKEGKYEEAEPVYRRAMKIFDDAMGRGNPLSTMIATNMEEITKIRGSR